MTETSASVRQMPAWLRFLKEGADLVGVLLFTTAFLGFVVQVFFRYVMNSPILWTEEVTMIAFVWTVFWAAAFMVNIRDHVTFDVVYELVSPQVKRVMAIFAMVVLIIAFVLLIPATWDYLQFLLRKRSPVLRLPMAWIYGCYLLFVVNFTIQAAWRLWRLFTPEWTKQI
ncbi:TRAP transporter small permease [Devosia sp. RR2S18]|jgi:TRAP-type C4-dicarboxylate transport system permease small subunit|uniref:TRAP transporter small permease n=1 Tax=Devosia rhizosphaerae TaxID=3049774 RepID=UPI0025400EF4|nr:TRAP transporter small permease [Devosia sp. RR2S18]WIJ26395.1 TRAP transporter small permease [Devosia sp. RR2S18]HEV7291139.1 TRAP transporter small permease [Devosia sp.]